MSLPTRCLVVGAAIGTTLGLSDVGLPTTVAVAAAFWVVVVVAEEVLGEDEEGSA